MKFRASILFAIFALAALMGLYVNSCEIPPEGPENSGRQTSGSLMSNDPVAPAPDDHYRNEADIKTPVDVAPVEVPVHDHEHGHDCNHGRPSGVMD